MRLSTRIHGAIDYALGLVLLILPWAAGVGGVGPAAWIAIGGGGLLIANAALTHFELGLIRRLQIPLHLWIDGFLGLALAVSPWVLAFDRTVWVPYVGLGALIVLVAFLTHTVPGYERRRAAEPRAGSRR
jgi:hypothetical protein